MDFSFNQDQLLIAETAEAFLSSVSGSAAVRTAMATEQGWDTQLWQRISEEMGWPLTHIPEQHGGLGLGYVELAILFENSGKRLLCAPLFSSVALAANALIVAGTEAQQQHLEQIAAGSRYTLAYAGRNRRYGGDAVEAEYELTDSGAVINGEFAYVVDGHTADTLIVAARQPASTGDAGIGLFMVERSAPGVSVGWTASMDQTRKLANVSLLNVAVNSVNIMRDVGAAQGHLDNILALAEISLAAEQLGVAEHSLQMTIDYISERKQFGRAVGSFQSMKHKAADMMSKVEAARSAVYYAACIADEFLAGSELGKELLEAASIAKSYSCDAAFFCSGCALQMHGGVGFTWEYDVHLYFKRAKSAQTLFGDSSWHQQRIADILLGPVQTAEPAPVAESRSGDQS